MKKIITISALALLATSCATITKGTSPQKVAINTVPAGAKVTVDGIKRTSPAVFDLKGNMDGYTIVAEKKGYETGTEKVQSKLRGLPTILGNILWLLPGIAIDFVTGAAFELESNKTVELEKK